MKISTLALVILSFFVVSTCAAVKDEKLEEAANGRKLRGQVVTENADPATTRTLEAVRRKAMANNKDQGGAQKDGGGQQQQQQQQQKQQQGEPLPPVPPTNPLGMVTWIVTPADSQAPPTIPSFAAPTMPSFPAPTMPSFPAPTLPFYSPPTVWIPPTPGPDTTTTTATDTNITWTRSPDVNTSTLTQDPATTFTSAPIFGGLTSSPAPTPGVVTGPCAQGSIYWDAAQYPLWATSLKCKTSSDCQSALLFSGCCQVGFCFCTGSYGSKDQCV